MQWIGDEVVFGIAASGEPRPSEFSCEKGSGRFQSMAAAVNAAIAQGPADPDSIYFAPTLFRNA